MTKYNKRRKKAWYKKWITSKKLEDKIGYKRNITLAHRKIRRHRASWDIFDTNLEHETNRKKGYRILKQINKDIKEMATIQGNVEENIFLHFYNKLWNSTDFNEPDLEWNLNSYKDNKITSDALEKRH